MNTKHLPLVLGLAVLGLVLVVVIGLAVIPPLLYQPHYSFVYTYSQDGYQPYSTYIYYTVEQGKVTEKRNTVTYNPNQPVPAGQITGEYRERIYLYDASKKASREISLDDAQKLTLDPNTISPDGFELGYGNSSGGIFPFVDYHDNYSTRYLVGHNTRHRVNLVSPDSPNKYYYGPNNLKFLGWVISQ